MSVVKIRALSKTPKIPLASAQTREVAKYAANRVAQMTVADMGISVEGATFWADVSARLAQIAETGELQ